MAVFIFSVILALEFVTGSKVSWCDIGFTLAAVKYGIQCVQTYDQAELKEIEVFENFHKSLQGLMYIITMLMPLFPNRGSRVNLLQTLSCFWLVSRWNREPWIGGVTPNLSGENWNGPHQSSSPNLHLGKAIATWNVRWLLCPSRQFYKVCYHMCLLEKCFKM